MGNTGAACWQPAPAAPAGDSTPAPSPPHKHNLPSLPYLAVALAQRQQRAQLAGLARRRHGRLCRRLAAAIGGKGVVRVQALLGQIFKQLGNDSIPDRLGVCQRRLRGMGSRRGGAAGVRRQGTGRAGCTAGARHGHARAAGSSVHAAKRSRSKLPHKRAQWCRCTRCAVCAGKQAAAPTWSWRI